MHNTYIILTFAPRSDNIPDASIFMNIDIFAAADRAENRYENSNSSDRMYCAVDIETGKTVLFRNLRFTAEIKHAYIFLCARAGGFSRVELVEKIS